MARTLRIHTIGVADDYPQSLVPLVLKSLGYLIEWTDSNRADIAIYGPFQKSEQQRFRWVPKPLRPMARKWAESSLRKYPPIRLFQTAENLRHNHVPCDFSIGFDLLPGQAQHYRLPYWMEQVDWSHEGVTGNQNPRFGELLRLDRLMQPLGQHFLAKPRRAAFFSSHLREPRGTLFRALGQVIPVDGFGPQFDAAVQHHSSSSFRKLDILADYAFNLCPENSMYPGYYTEKIPEAFQSDCLPISWVDTNVEVDFNPQAILNLAPMTANNFSGLAEILGSPKYLAQFADAALLLQRPSLEGLKSFLQTVSSHAL